MAFDSTAENYLTEGLIDPGALLTELSKIVSGMGGDGADSQVRTKVLARLKQVSVDGRKRIEQILLEDGEGTPCSERLSALQDEIIRVIHDFALKHVFTDTQQPVSQLMTILAVGGYGRGTLAPGSDLDLLFLLPHKQTPHGESLVEYILYLLWDMGFKVGHATRNTDECIQLSREDMTIRTSILESRLICGTEALYVDLLDRFDLEVVSNTAEEFIAAKLAERDARHEKSGRSRYLVEPNVKDGKGGLRDLHTLYWIAKYYYRVRRQRDLVEAGVLSENEFIRFRQAQDFLWSVRCHMHFLTGRAEERLSFDIQGEMANRMGFDEKLGVNAVESFMKRYFRVAKDVGDLTRIICSSLEELQAKAAPGFTRIIRSLRHRTKKIPRSDVFVTQNNRINVVDQTVFSRDPVNILRMYSIAEKRDLKFHPDAVKLVTRSLGLIDDNLRKNKTANTLFLDILTSRKNPEATLRKMNESDVLGHFIPEFGHIVAMMQFNMYHHYTVDEHLLRSIGVLSDIEHGRLGDEHPLANEILPGVQDRKILYVALLLHDIAKGRPEDHSIAGARIAREVCPRLGLNKAKTDLVCWLVEQHLVMSNTAQTRDLGDHQTIKDFAKIMQSVERLRYLLILTVCDTRAVGPGVWNGWKGQLLRTLYYETEPLLTGGFSQVSHTARLQKIRADVEAQLQDWQTDERQRVLDLHYPAYILATPVADQVRHMEFIRDSDAQQLALATSVFCRSFEAVTEITILAPDHPRLLSIIAGACAAAGANIVGAQVHTTSDGRALDSILVNREFDLDDDEQRRGSRIGRLIEDVLTGKIYLPDMIAQRTKPGRGEKVFEVPPKVSITNNLSSRYSVIEVEGLDRRGLLSDLTLALADLNLDIASAHIVTFGEKVIDTFYVTDLVGHKIEDNKRVSTTRKNLLGILRRKKSKKPSSSKPDREATDPQPANP